MNIYVGNLASDVTEEDLTALFSEFGQVKEAKVIKDMFSQESRGSAVWSGESGSAAPPFPACNVRPRRVHA